MERVQAAALDHSFAVDGRELGWAAGAHLRVLPPPAADLPCRHQAAAQAPLKWLRGYADRDGRLQLPLLHTAGGLVGGDRLDLSLELEAGSRALLTSVAAQKVYEIGRAHV